MLTALGFLVCIGAGIVGGVFFGFSTFVMKALGQLPPPHGIEAMQRINVVVLNPAFLGVFLGTAALAGLCVAMSFFSWGDDRALLLFLSGLLYLAGCFGVTVVYNVPRNERLARMGIDSPEAASYWPVYLREWLLWNHARTIAAVLAAGCSAAALALGAAA